MHGPYRKKFREIKERSHSESRNTPSQKVPRNIYSLKVKGAVGREKFLFAIALGQLLIVESNPGSDLFQTNREGTAS